MMVVEVQVLLAGKKKYFLILILDLKHKLFLISSGGTGSIFRNGTCFTSSECQNKGGSTFGSCAAG